MSLTYQDTPDKVYYDITVSNLATINTPPPQLYFNETRNNPFVYDPESYYLSIVRFSLDTQSLPILVPEIQPDQPDRDLTIYSVSLTWTNPASPFQTFTQQTFIEFIPQNKIATVPAPPSQTNTKLQNSQTAYYDIYNYQYWIYLINNAWETCFNDLNTQVVGAGLTLPTTHAPVMTWDTQQNIAVINADYAGYNDTTSNYIGMWFNPALYNLFSSFPVLVESLVGGVNGLNVRIITLLFGGGNLVYFPPTSAPASQYQAIQVIQEYSTISNWSPIGAVVFTSNTLPIVPNNISAPAIYYNGTQFITGGNNSNIAQVLTDFVGDEAQYKPFILYEPTAQYRLTNLVGNKPIYNLDIEVYYKNRVGELVPFRLGSGCTATIKILFTRRGTEADYKP